MKMYLEWSLVAVASILVCMVLQFLEWAWFKPRRLEKFMRSRGMKGTSYRFLFGDAKETARMYEDVYSRPIGLHDDVVPRLMPNINHYYNKYGDFCFSWAGPRPRIFIIEPASVREVLNKWRVYVKHYKVSSEGVKSLTTGIASLEGDMWSKSRSKFNPTFKPDKLRPLVPAIKACGEDILGEWRELAAKSGGRVTVDVFPYMEKLTGAVLARLIFNTPYTDRIKSTFHDLSLLAFAARVHSKILTFPGEKYLPTKGNKRVNELHESVIRKFTMMIIERYEHKIKAPQEESDFQDLLDLFMEELYNDNLSKSDRKRIISDVVGQLKLFFFAGFETSSNAVTWALVLLSIHQDIQDRAREEIRQVLGDKKEIMADDVAQLKYVGMIVSETLRLFPSIMELTRIVDEDTKIKDFIIPKGSLITLPLLMIHRNTSVWGKDANEFRPERFIDGASKAAASGQVAYMPFGWGPRMCLGSNFATIEAKILLTEFMREFRFEISPKYVHAPVVAFTIQPQYGAHLVLTKL